MAKKYVPAGVFLTCDKGTLPTTLNVVFNARTVFHGQNVATDLDAIPQTNIPSMGVCSVSKGPCLLVPAGKWSPVKDDVQLGSGHPLLEDSQLRCGLTGCISIHFSLAEAQAACPPPPAPEASVLDQLDERMKGWGPLGAYGRFQLGVGEGLWAGGKGLAEGLWGVAKGGWNAAMHPVDTAHAIGEGASNAYQWAGDSQNWSNAAHSAGQGISDAASWAGNGDNWHHVGEQLGSMSPRDWGKVTGRVGFEVGLTVATAGAGTALVAAAETSRLARAALLVARVADVEGLALSAAGKLARTAAGQMRILGKFVTGARQGRRVAQAAREARAALRASPLGRKLKAVAAWVERKRKCLWDPIDVASGVMLFNQVDWEMPGPLPFVWQRYWYSNSEYAGPLGHGWHHSYDATLLVREGQVAVRLPDGRLALFTKPVGPGERVFNRAERLELSHLATGDYAVFSLDTRLTYYFAPLAPDAARPIGSPAPMAGEVYCHLTHLRDPNNFTIQLAYDAVGQLRTLTDCAGRQVRLHYDGQGRIMALEVPLPGSDGVVTAMRYDYDEAGNLTTTWDALEYAVHYAYQEHLLVRKTLSSGTSFYFEYAGTGAAAQCLRTWGDGGLLAGRFEFGMGRTTAFGAIAGDVRTYEHTDGLVTRETDPLGAASERSYNEHGDLILERNALGHATSYTYDPRGNLTQTTYADGGKVTTRYNAQDLPTQVTDVGGGNWLYAYDDAGNLLTKTDPVGRVVLHYDYTAGLMSAASNQAIRLQYDAQHNLSRVTTADGQVRTLAYDALGRLCKLTNAQGQMQQRAYDVLGQLIAVTSADGSRSAFTYDGEGNIVRAQDAQQDVYLHYTALGQLSQRRQAGTETVFTYDSEGRLTGLRNAHQQSYRFVLDLVGRVVEEHGFDEQVRRYTYDAAGRLATTQQPTGLTTTYQYDALARVVQVQDEGGRQEHYQYDLAGNVVAAITADATLHFAYNAWGQLVAETQNGHLVTSHYDELGLRQALHSSLGAAVTFEHDAHGRLSQVRAGDWQSRITRDADGRELHRQLTGGLRTSWQHDAAGRPSRQQIVPPQGPARQRHYHWQAAGRLAGLDDTLTGSLTFTHDAFGALAATHYPDGHHELRQPDAVGNLFRTPDRTDRTYSPSGQLRTANGTRYKYDAAGNLVQKTTAQGQQWRYHWDGAGQLTRVDCPNGYAVTFGYDALGRRVRKRYRGKVTRWVWDGQVPLHEWHELEVGPGAGAVQELTTWLFEQDTLAPLAKLTAQGGHSVVCDHLGTPLALYDGQGALSWQAQLDSYGAVRQGRGKAQDCPFRYPGQYEDVETGLYYNRFRYYDPETGQYLSPDPLGLAGGGALHAYVADPLTQHDALGLSEGSGDLGRRLIKQQMTHGITELNSKGQIVFPKSDFRAHHLVPHEVWTANQSFFDEIGLDHVPRQINPKDAFHNGVFLPGTEEVGTKYGFDAFHAGGHPDTNRDMGDEVRRIRRRFETSPARLTAAGQAQARKEIADLQIAERNRLSSRRRRPCTIMP